MPTMYNKTSTVLFMFGMGIYSPRFVKTAVTEVNILPVYLNYS